MAIRQYHRVGGGPDHGSEPFFTGIQVSLDTCNLGRQPLRIKNLTERESEFIRVVGFGQVGEGAEGPPRYDSLVWMR